MDSFELDELDFWCEELDNRVNNPIYPPISSEGFNPADIFTAPDGHIYTPDEICLIMNGNGSLDVNSDSTNLNNLEIGKMSFEDDPNGGVIVTDIFGGKHHYSDMDQAMCLTDVLSGMPIYSGISTSSTGGESCDHCPNLPTDVHTPVDLTFYDKELDDAQSKLDEAFRELENCNSVDDMDNAKRRIEDAKKDIEYWERCRRNSSYDQTINNIKSDKLTNDINRALNDLHNTLHHV